MNYGQSLTIEWQATVLSEIPNPSCQPLRTQTSFGHTIVRQVTNPAAVTPDAGRVHLHEVGARSVAGPVAESARSLEPAGQICRTGAGSRQHPRTFAATRAAR